MLNSTLPQDVVNVIIHEAVGDFPTLDFNLLAKINLVSKFFNKVANEKTWVFISSQIANELNIDLTNEPVDIKKKVCRLYRDHGKRTDVWHLIIANTPFLLAILKLDTEKDIDEYLKKYAYLRQDHKRLRIYLRVNIYLAIITCHFTFLAKLIAYIENNNLRIDQIIGDNYFFILPYVTTCENLDKIFQVLNMQRGYIPLFLEKLVEEGKLEIVLAVLNRLEQNHSDFLEYASRFLSKLTNNKHISVIMIADFLEKLLNYFIDENRKISVDARVTFRTALNSFKYSTKYQKIQAVAIKFGIYTENEVGEASQEAEIYAMHLEKIKIQCQQSAQQSEILSCFNNYWQLIRAIFQQNIEELTSAVMQFQAAIPFKVDFPYILFSEILNDQNLGKAVVCKLFDLFIIDHLALNSIKRLLEKYPCSHNVFLVECYFKKVAIKDDLENFNKLLLHALRNNEFYFYKYYVEIVGKDHKINLMLLAQFFVDPHHYSVDMVNYLVYCVNNGLFEFSNEESFWLEFFKQIERNFDAEKNSLPLSVFLYNLKKEYFEVAYPCAKEILSKLYDSEQKYVDAYSDLLGFDSTCRARNFIDAIAGLKNGSNAESLTLHPVKPNVL